MNKFKKIGLTALAGSLVATSAFAGELTATGSASISVLQTLLVLMTKVLVKTGQWLTHVVLTGSGELDNGMTVSTSFELDQG
jgi:outer membrane protein OmpU